jgi:dihydrofolate reductase
MGRIALSQHLSLDGVMQSPGPTDVPFKYRGWIMDFDRGPEGDRFQLEQAQNAEALLLGRVTYEAMQAFWPTAEGEFADRLNELPKYVVSSTLTDPPWNATVLGDDWAQEVARLRTELDGEIVVYGSRRLSQALTFPCRAVRPTPSCRMGSSRGSRRPVPPPATRTSASGAARTS